MTSTCLLCMQVCIICVSLLFWYSWFLHLNSFLFLFFFFCVWAHPHPHMHTENVFDAAVRGLISGSRELSLPLSRVCVPATPHIHVMSDEALILWRSETYPSWEQERWGEPVREKYSEWEQEKKIWVEGRMGENKSKGASDVNNNEEHGGGCQGGHHDITTCKSATAFYC